MNAKRFVTLTLILTLSLVCLLNCSASQYPEGAFDFTTLGTKRTLEATHIIVGKVTHVSFVFEQGFSGPISLVTVRVDKDIKAEIERVDNQETNPPEGQASEKDRKTPPQTVTFVQVGGPYPLVKFLPFFEGGWVTAAGVRVLKRGERVFLRLLPTTSPYKHNGQPANSYTHEFGTMYSVQGEGDDVDQHIISRGWQGIDVTVLQMARIVRATLKRPERMRTLERRVNALKRPRRYRRRDVLMSPDTRLSIVMNEVAAIETELNLSPLEGQ